MRRATLAGFCALGLLAGCAGHGGRGPTTAAYEARARGDYNPPGPPSDPWGPYIREASQHFDVPQSWIRAVMQQESGGHEYMDGHLTVSSAGAMGLMQLEPETYQEMAARYGLGADPFDPYDNIMAGTAYIHEMYQVYGAPGFLAAYNAGPGRVDDYMTYHTPLPDETLNYVASVAPEIQGDYPQNRSPADEIALNTTAMGAPGGLLPPGVSAPPPLPEAPPANPFQPVRVAAIGPVPEAREEPVPEAREEPAPQSVTAPQTPTPASTPISAALPEAVAENDTPSNLSAFAASAQAAPVPTPVPTSVPAPVRSAAAEPVESLGLYTPPAGAPASYAPPPPAHRDTGFSLVSSAMADTPAHAYAASDDAAADRGWAIQVGAYGSRAKAHTALGLAELSAVGVLMGGHPEVVAVDAGGGRIYRARYVGLSHEKAAAACARLAGGRTGCVVLSPDAQD